MARSRSSWLLVVALALGASARAGAATLQVANTGADGPACGGVGAPCRSIRRAVINAAPGDTITVGPGFYGPDIDADGVGNEPGEEPATGIIVDKAVRIFSKFGASSTSVRSFFHIQASGAQVGKLNNGFTIAVGGNPMLIGGGSELVGVRVGGNVLSVDGPVGAAAVLAVNTRGGRLEHNRVVAPNGCSAGFFLSDSGDLITRNVVMGCSVGFFSDASSGARFVRNTAIGNLFATSVGNRFGFDLRGDVAEFTGNVAIGNGTGVLLGPAIPVFRDNVFYANSTNCGVSNFSGTTINAANNYWGSPSGPGTDPADTACDSSPGSVTVTTPFLTVEPPRPQSALR